MPKQPQPPLKSVSREQALGQVRASLRPFNVDSLEVRESLFLALSLGYDPRQLYLEAVRSRPPGYEPAPPLQRVLPPSVLEYLEKQDDLDREDELPESPPK